MASATQGRDTRFEQIGDRDHGIYALTLRETKAGRFYVTRGEWWLWGGKVVVMNAHRVSPYYRKRDATRAFCMGYCEENPGCKTSSQAQAMADDQPASREEDADA